MNRLHVDCALAQTCLATLHLMMEDFRGYLTHANFQFADPHKREADGGAQVDERGASGATREHVPQSQSQSLIGDGTRYVGIHLPFLSIVSVCEIL